MEIIGYARVSSRDQNLDMQIDALHKEGCEIIYREKISGVKERVELYKAISTLRSGDIFVVWKLDRIGRSLKELISIIDNLNRKGIKFKSIMDGVDTRTPIGRCQIAIFGALAEFERDSLIERTNAGLISARERGRIGGRPKGLTKEGRKKAKLGKKMYQENSYTIEEICKILEIKSKATLYRYLRYEKVLLNRAIKNNNEK